MRRSSKHLPGIAFALTLTFTLAPALLAPSAALAADPVAAAGPREAGPPREGPPFRPAPPPSALERARVERWVRAWREEAAALERSFEAALRAAATGDDGALPPRCVDLAGAVLALERPRVLPVPDRAADLYLRRALRHLARGAVTCLTHRPYAARYNLDRAADAFGQARRVLRRYRQPPRAPEAPPAPP